MKTFSLLLDYVFFYTRLQFGQFFQHNVLVRLFFEIFGNELEKFSKTKTPVLKKHLWKIWFRAFIYLFGLSSPCSVDQLPYFFSPPSILGPTNGPFADVGFSTCLYTKNLN